MGVVALVASVALAAVFIVSGLAKLADRDGTREAVSGFGVPPRLVPVVSTCLAPAELVTAALVLVPATARAGLVIAIGLLLGFSLAVVIALRAGRRPECHCFGRIGGADVSARTVVRNVILIVLAVVGLVGLATAERPTGGPLVLAVLGGLAVAVLIIGAEGLAGRAARARRAAEDEVAYARMERPVAPPFRLPDLAGGDTSLADLLRPGLPVLLLSLSPGCGSCQRLRPDVAQWASLLDTRLTVAVLASGTVDANRASYQEHAQLRVLSDEEGEARRGLGIAATPSAVLVGPDGVLASGVASGEALVRRLLVSVATGADVPEAQEPPDSTGTPVDELSLTSVVTPRASVEPHPLGESTLLLDTSTGATLVLDQLGTLIWSVLDGASPLAEIVTDLSEVYGTPAEQVGADVLGLVRALGEAGLLEGVAPQRTGTGGHQHDHAGDPGPALTPDHAGA